MKYRTQKREDHNNFLLDLCGGNLTKSMDMEAFIMDKMDEYDPNYIGGMWDMILFRNGAKAMVFGSFDDPKFQIPKQDNGYSGKMSPLAFSLTLNLFFCSVSSFDRSEAGDRLGENYHLLYESLDNDIEELGDILRYLD